MIDMDVQLLSYLQTRMSLRGDFIGEWNYLLHLCGYKCVACGAKKNLEADHIVAQGNGGEGFIDNVQPLCRSCNARKWTKTIDYRSNSVRACVDEYIQRVIELNSEFPDYARGFEMLAFH